MDAMRSTPAGLRWTIRSDESAPMTADFKNSVTLDYSAEQRRTPRQSMGLPILIDVSGDRQCALLQNLSTTGAMIFTGASLRLGTKIELLCGSICATGTIVWQRLNDFGLKFDRAIAENHVDQEASRWEAIAARRKLKD